MRGDHIKANGFHDAGAIARCSYCGRYSDYYKALTRADHYKCDCGKTGGWCGSFKKPTHKDEWSGAGPSNDIITDKMSDEEYGPEWEAEMKKHSKAQLIDKLGKSWRGKKEILKPIRDAIAEVCHDGANHVICNLYRDSINEALEIADKAGGK